MPRRHLFLPLMLCVSLGNGWRYDGTGAPTAATPPSTWSASWRVPVGELGKASPVSDGRLIYVQLEPTTLLALDLATGEERWRRAHPVIDALPEDQRADKRAWLDVVQASSETLEADQRQFPVLSRQVRRGEASQDALEALTTRIAKAKGYLASAKAYLTPPNADDVGWAAPTPLVVPDGVVASYGSGVVARHTRDGEIVWQRWLGPTDKKKLSYDGADSASPFMAGDTLVVPATHLTGLDPATGAIRWTAGKHRSFGTPSVARAGELVAILLADGRVLDATTGQSLPGQLPQVAYQAPVARGAEIWVAGALGDGEPLKASAWTLGLDGSTTRRWERDLDSRDRLYATPLITDEHLVLVTRHRRLIVLQRQTGEIVVDRTLDDAWGEVVASPALVGDTIFVTTRGGGVLALDSSVPFAVKRTHTVPSSMSTPHFFGPHVVAVGSGEVVRYSEP